MGVARRMGIVLLLLLAALLAWQLGAPPKQLLFRGGPILTLDARGSLAEALAIEGDRILAVGSESAVRAAAPGARVVELEGRALLPAFVDAHGHFPGEGIDAIHADLNSPPIGDLRSLDELVARLAEHAEGVDAGGWVLGLGYDDTLLADGRHPTRADLDRVSLEHPVAALHISGHLAAVNSRALAELAIEEATPDPPGGRIRREAGTRRPDGVLEEEAMHGVAEQLQAIPLRDVLRVGRLASRRYLAQGVATAQTGYADARQVRGLPWLSRLGLIDLRLVVWPDAAATDALLAGDLAWRGGDPAWVRRGAVKLVADGSIQGYTGYLSRPYHVPPGDDPSYRGYPRIPREELMRLVARYHDAGLQVAVHGNGDASIDDILDAFAAAQAGRPRPDARHVVIHAQMARDDQLDRMGELGVIPSFFVLHTYYWGDRHRERFMGPERAARMSPARSALERGLRFTLHADSPVVPMEALRLVWSAVERRSASGARIGEAQRIGVMEALRAVTLDAAYQHFEEDRKGSLEVGKLADLVILDRSPLEAPEEIHRIRVLETWVGGRRVHRARP